MKDRISVAMAVCNGAAWLPEQLDSILPQLGSDDELVISYDESSDDTLAIINKYASEDVRIKIVINEVTGITGNFNTAISCCTGDYIFISDQDDRWADNKVERVLRCFEETGADLVIHNGFNTDAALNPEGKPFFDIYRIGNGKVRNILKFRGSGCCMAFTEKMKDNLLPLPEIHGYDQWIAVVSEFTGQIAYLEDILIYHRMHDGNATPRTSRKLSVIFRMRARLIASLITRLIRIRRDKE